MALLALGWGIIAGSALFVGAVFGWLTRPPERLIASLIAFASGLLLSVAAFDLLDEAFAAGGFLPAAMGYMIGAAVFAAGLYGLDRVGARHRKRARVAPEASRSPGAVVMLATALAGVPESLIIGRRVSRGEGLALATLLAVFSSNIPESLASTIRMRALGHGAVQVFGLWAVVAVTSGLAALAGYLLFADLAPEAVAITQALAGGALLVYVADAMIPEAFTEAGDAAGLVVALGFLSGFALSHGLG